MAAEVGREWVSTLLIQTGKLRRVYRIGCRDLDGKMIDDLSCASCKESEVLWHSRKRRLVEGWT